jgi:hypothetical protein
MIKVGEKVVRLLSTTNKQEYIYAWVGDHSDTCKKDHRTSHFCKIFKRGFLKNALNFKEA